MDLSRADNGTEKNALSGAMSEYPDHGQAD